MAWLRISGVIAFGIAAGLTVTACGSGPGSAAPASAAGSKPLSLTTVTVAGYEGSVNWASLWAAQAEGFYAKQGLTVKFVNTTASAASMVAATIGDSYQFIAADPVGLPDAVHVMFGGVAPVSMEPPLAFTTSESMIESHPDTVQAFVTATVEGWEYTRQHPSQTKQIDSRVFPTVGVTDASKIGELYQLDQQHRGSTPAITGAEYQAIQDVLQAAGTPTTVSYGGFVDSSFVNQAITQLKLGLPTGSAAG